METAVLSLSNRETDVFIAAGVDLAGDIRSFCLHRSVTDKGGPTAEDSSPVVPAEGAAAIVLKRLDKALEDQDRIYGVIQNVASASGGALPAESGTSPDPFEGLFENSLKRVI